MIQTEAMDPHQISKVELVDLEDAAYMKSPRGSLKGMQIGNVMWRSPESHAKGPVRIPSDMFSFGVVVSAHSEKAVIPHADEFVVSVSMP